MAFGGEVRKERGKTSVPSRTGPVDTAPCGSIDANRAATAKKLSGQNSKLERSTPKVHGSKFAKIPVRLAAAETLRTPALREAISGQGLLSGGHLCV